MGWVSHHREGILHAHLLYDVHLVEFSPPHLVIRLSKAAPKDLPQQLQSFLKKTREEVWTIAISDEIGHPTLHEKNEHAQKERQNAILQAPLVKMLREAFPGTSLVKIDDM